MIGANKVGDKDMSEVCNTLTQQGIQYIVSI